MNWKDPDGVSRREPERVSKRSGCIASIIPDDSEGQSAAEFEKSGD